MLDKYFTVIDTPSGCRTYQCRLCGETFSDADDAGWHYMETHKAVLAGGVATCKPGYYVYICSDIPETRIRCCKQGEVLEVIFNKEECQYSLRVKWVLDGSEEVIPYTERCIPTNPRDMEAVITVLRKAKKELCALGLEFLIELNEYGPELTLKTFPQPNLYTYGTKDTKEI